MLRHVGSLNSIEIRKKLRSLSSVMPSKVFFKYAILKTNLIIGLNGKVRINFNLTLIGLIILVFLGKASNVPHIAKGIMGVPDLSAIIATPIFASPIFPSLDRCPSGNNPTSLSSFNNFITFNKATLSLVDLFTGIQFAKSHKNLNKKFLLYTSSAAKKFIFLLV